MVETHAFGDGILLYTPQLRDIKAKLMFSVRHLS